MFVNGTPVLAGYCVVWCPITVGIKGDFAELRPFAPSNSTFLPVLLPFAGFCAVRAFLLRCVRGRQKPSVLRGQAQMVSAEQRMVHGRPRIVLAEQDLVHGCAGMPKRRARTLSGEPRMEFRWVQMDGR